MPYALVKGNRVGERVREARQAAAKEQIEVCAELSVDFGIELS